MKASQTQGVPQHLLGEGERPWNAGGMVTRDEIHRLVDVLPEDRSRRSARCCVPPSRPA